MNKELSITTIMFLVIATGVFYLNQNFLQKNKPIMPEEKSEPVKTEIVDTSKQIPLSEVVKRNTPDSCWVIIDGSVYDLSVFINKHPGGVNAIATSCGADGTNVFNTRGDRGSHSDSAKEKLAEFWIGKLER